MSKSFPIFSEILDLIERDLALIQRTDKRTVHDYIDRFYQPYIELVEDLPNRILEIGIHNGGSIALWALAFPNAEIFGVDIKSSDNPNPKFLELIDDNRIKTILADAYNQEFLGAIPNDFDLIIDDGPHTVTSQLEVLKYRSKLSHKGTLIIEDVSYKLDSINPLFSAIPQEERHNFLIIPFLFSTGRFDDIIILYSRSSDIIKSFNTLRNRLKVNILRSRNMNFMLRIYFAALRAWHNLS